MEWNGKKKKWKRRRRRRTTESRRSQSWKKMSIILMIFPSSNLRCRDIDFHRAKNPHHLEKQQTMMPLRVRLCVYECGYHYTLCFTVEILFILAVTLLASTIFIHRKWRWHIYLLQVCVTFSFYQVKTCALQEHEKEALNERRGEKNAHTHTRHCLIIQFNWFTKVTHKEAKGKKNPNDEHGKTFCCSCDGTLICPLSTLSVFSAF